MNDYFVGTELKIAINIECEGFDMNSDSWTARVVKGSKSIVCDKMQNSVKDENDNWYITIDSSILGSGIYYLVTEIDVPDDDFADGFRHEVVKQELLRMKSV